MTLPNTDCMGTLLEFTECIDDPADPDMVSTTHG